MTDKILVFVTCGSRKEARRIAQELVKRRLAACVNEAGGPLRSTYRWKGKIETAREFLLIIKTTRKQFGKLRAAVQRLHSYDLPEVIALPIVEGSAEYLKWITEAVGKIEGSPKGFQNSPLTYVHKTRG